MSLDINSYQESLSSLTGQAKIDFIANYINSLAQIEMIKAIQDMLRHRMVFSDITCKVVILHFDLISSDELKQIESKLTGMRYEVWYEVGKESIIFTLTQ